MTHASEGMLQAYLDGEVDATVRPRLESHLAECAACASELRSLRGLAVEVSSLLRVLDTPISLEAGHDRFTANRKARTNRVWILRGLARSSLLKAAALLLILAGAASAAIPGSPMRHWLASAWRGAESWFGGGPSSVSAPAAAPTPAQPTTTLEDAVPSGGAAILPMNGEIQIFLSSPAADTRVHVREVTGTRASVRLLGDNEGVRFRSGPGRLSATGLGAGDVLVDLPRGVDRATVYLNGRLYVSKEGKELRFLGPAADSVGDEIIFRSRS